MRQIVPLFLIYSSIFIANCAGSANVYVSYSNIVDESGRTRLYHGGNFVVKEFPWYPHELLDSNYVANLSKLGLNFVRLGMMWSGVEPQPKQYNKTYLNIMETIIKLLGENNIFVLLDMHQDALSSRTGTYDGIPLWLYERFPPPAHPYPWPLQSAPSSADWFLNYLTEACSHGFQCLYNNTDGATDSMVDFWRLIASTYLQYSNVLGYEIINEPWAGNYLDNPELILPGIAGSKNLQPFYEKIAKAIRSVDDNALIFYEPVTWGVRLNGEYFGTGFTHVPGGDSYRNRSVLSYHYYCIILSLEPVPSNSTIPVADRVVCNDIEGPALFRSVQVDLDDLGGSSFLTEFGGCGDTSPTCEEQLEWGLNAADLFLQSWAFWGDFSDYAATAKRLARVYARAIAAMPYSISMQYIPVDNTFYLSYLINLKIKQPTEIFVPPMRYPKSSYNVTVNDALTWKVDPTDPTIILVEPSDKARSEDPPPLGSVIIRPKDKLYI